MSAHGAGGAAAGGGGEEVTEVLDIGDLGIAGRAEGSLAPMSLGFMGLIVKINTLIANNEIRRSEAEDEFFQPTAAPLNPFLLGTDGDDFLIDFRFGVDSILIGLGGG